MWLLVTTTLFVILMEHVDTVPLNVTKRQGQTVWHLVQKAIASVFSAWPSARMDSKMVEKDRPEFMGIPMNSNGEGGWVCNAGPWRIAFDKRGFPIVSLANVKLKLELDVEPARTIDIIQDYLREVADGTLNLFRDLSESEPSSDELAKAMRDGHDRATEAHAKAFRARPEQDGAALSEAKEIDS
jgi:hypothetical protein